MTPSRHDHVFLGERHGEAERNVWATVALTVAMMALEIVGGLWIGSLALVADGFHMSTHAGALIVAALAYTLARRHAHDARFTFGAGKFGDLAGFSSALVLAIIALEIAWEAAHRLLAPAPSLSARRSPSPRSGSRQHRQRLAAEPRRPSPSRRRAYARARRDADVVLAGRPAASASARMARRRASAWKASRGRRLRGDAPARAARVSASRSSNATARSSPSKRSRNRTRSTRW